MYRLIYSTSGENGDTWLRAHGDDVDELIALADAEAHWHEDCHIADRRGHLIYGTGLGREVIQDDPPDDPGPEWWQDAAGRWHQQPC